MFLLTLIYHESSEIVLSIMEVLKSCRKLLFYTNLSNKHGVCVFGYRIPNFIINSVFLSSQCCCLFQMILLYHFEIYTTIRVSSFSCDFWISGTRAVVYSVSKSVSIQEIVHRMRRSQLMESLYLLMNFIIDFEVFRSILRNHSDSMQS